jgi:hypothetical protein
VHLQAVAGKARGGSDKVSCCAYVKPLRGLRSFSADLDAVVMIAIVSLKWCSI